MALHLGIDGSLRVGFFRWVMLTAYIAFLPPQTVSAWVLAARDRLQGARLRRPRARAERSAPAASP